MSLCAHRAEDGLRSRFLMVEFSKENLVVMIKWGGRVSRAQTEHSPGDARH
jgi:hypothetical protein